MSGAQHRMLLLYFRCACLLRKDPRERGAAPDVLVVLALRLPLP